MPTKNRRQLLQLALACYLSQNFQERELVLLDDGDSVADLVDGLPGVLYRRCEPMSLGAKRNLCCDLASGDVIVHWDDDDWSAPTRIENQLRHLQASKKQLTGYHSLFFWSVILSKAFEYRGAANYSCGTALCYRKEFWKLHPFPDLDYAEDNNFVRAAQASKEIAAVPGWQQLVVRAHATSSKPGRVGGNSAKQVPAESLPREFFEDMARCNSI